MQRFGIPSEFWRSLSTGELAALMELLDRGAESADRRVQTAHKRATSAINEYIEYGRLWIHVVDQLADEREVTRLSMTMRAGLEHRSAELRLAVAELVYAVRGIAGEGAENEGAS